jgi:hypothetical protein
MKDEALKLVLEALKIARDQIVDPEYAPIGWSVCRLDEVLANGQQALAAPVQELVAWKWHQAPVKTSWGQEMVVADLAIDKDNTVSIYCERDQTNRVEAMFNSPAAQRQCNWPTCQSEEYQQALAEQINQELVTGAAQWQCEDDK